MSSKIDYENQPRYVIDEGQPPENRKILPEEQFKALKKLMSAGGHALDSDERELIEKIEEKLQQETQRVKNLQKMTVGDKPLDSYLEQNKKKNNHLPSQTEEDYEEGDNGGDEEEQESKPRKRPTQKKIVGFAPDEVVKRYLESFNQQRFGAEFDCFSKDFMTTDRESYIQARQKYYQQQQSLGGLKITCEEIVSTDVMGGIAEVVATKCIQSGNKKPKYETDVYHLKLENGRWVINMVEPQDD